MACVLLPTALGTVYYYGIASDQYISEARFVIRSPGHGGAGGTSLMSMLGGAGLSRSQDDAYSVNDYMLSRDALEELVKNDDLRAVFSRPDADFLARFPNPFSRNTTFESLYKYYQKHVDVLLDTTTGVTTLQVRTFTPEDSQRIADALLDAGERLVNRLNERALNNAIGDARRDVAREEARITAVQAQIATFRNKETVIDPTKQSQTLLLGVAELDKQLAETQTFITQLSRTSPNSPQLVTAQRRADAIKAQISTQQNRVAGSDTSMVPRITAFDALHLQEVFAEKALTSATTSLEAARIDAERQQLYLDRVVAPNLSDYSLYPRRFVAVATIFAIFFSLYLILRLLVVGVLEHRAH